jgi:hypothetical protein
LNCRPDRGWPHPAGAGASTSLIGTCGAPAEARARIHAEELRAAFHARASREGVAWGKDKAITGISGGEWGVRGFLAACDIHTGEQVGPGM